MFQSKLHVLCILPRAGWSRGSLHGLLSNGWLCGFGKQDHPQGSEWLLPCQAQACQMGSVGAQPHLAGDTALCGGCWCKSAAAGLLAASLTLPLLVINPPLVQEKTLCSSKHDMNCLLTPAACTVPELGVQGCTQAPVGPAPCRASMPQQNPPCPLHLTQWGLPRLVKAIGSRMARRERAVLPLDPVPLSSGAWGWRQALQAGSGCGDGLLQRMLKRACQLSLCLIYSLLPAPLCREKTPEVSGR